MFLGVPEGSPEYRAACERAAGEIAQTDVVIRELDEQRSDLGISKAELARRINRNASVIRRLFTASQPRPELPLVAPIADALGAELRVIPRTAEEPTTQSEPGTGDPAAGANLPRWAAAESVLGGSSVGCCASGRPPGASYGT